MHGIQTNKKFNVNSQVLVIKKIEFENAMLHPGAKVTYMGWLTRKKKRKLTFFLIVEFATK